MASWKKPEMILLFLPLEITSCNSKRITNDQSPPYYYHTDHILQISRSPDNFAFLNFLFNYSLPFNI
jgi:hypothetical protein